MNNYYTYAYLREDGTPYYIGKGIGKRAFYKYGKKEIKPPKDKSRIIFLKQNLTEEKAFKHEIYMIAVFGRKDLETGILRNRTNGGEGSISWSKESKKKMSDLKKGKKRPEEHRKKISEGRKGIKLSEEHKKKISESLKGRILSEESREKISISNKGKVFSKESKEKMSMSKRNRIISEETKAKMSISQKRRRNVENLNK